MSGSSLRELGADLVEERQYERALAAFAEAVRRQPADHRARMAAARCFAELGEKERAVTALHACAEGLLRRDYLLSAIAACKQALALAPNEKRLRETLHRVHARALRDSSGTKAGPPPPLPPEALYAGSVEEDLLALQGTALSDKAIEVLAAPDPGPQAEVGARPPLPLFSHLPGDAFVELAARMSYRELKPDEVLCRENEGGNSIFVLVAGKAEVSRDAGGERKTLGILGGGSIFGEVSLLAGAPAGATVCAMVDSEVFEITREHLNQLTKQHPEVMPALAEFAQYRLAKSLVAGSPLFQQLTEKDRIELVRRFSFRALQPGERATVEGEPSPGLYLVLAGDLAVQKRDANGEVLTVGRQGEGGIVGEISLVTGLPATATVQAVGKTAVGFLARGAYASVVQAFPHIETYLQALSARRLQELGEALRPAEVLDADALVLES